MNETPLKTTPRKIPFTHQKLLDEMAATFRCWKAEGQIEVLKAHIERLRKMGWTFNV